MLYGNLLAALYTTVQEQSLSIYTIKWTKIIDWEYIMRFLASVMAWRLETATDSERIKWLVFWNTSVLHFHYFQKLHWNLHFFGCYYSSSGKWTRFLGYYREKYLKIPLIISVALENSGGERAKCLWTQESRYQVSVIVTRQTQASSSVMYYVSFCELNCAIHWWIPCIRG